MILNDRNAPVLFSVYVSISGAHLNAILHVCNKKIGPYQM